MRRITMPAALVALALLAGCVSIPTGGGVTSIEVEADGIDNPLLSLPSLPAQDATPAEIVAGFIRAGRGPQEDYRVAREYLTGELRESWSPAARTLISSTPIEPEPLADNTWSVTINAGSSVDAQGRYQTVSPAASFDLAFGLVKDDAGQWRISSAPDGTVLPPDRFASIFTSYELYFFDPSGDFLVPDLRWYRSGEAAVPSVIDGLLAGPSDRLGAGILASAFPPGTERTGTPTLVDGTATVQLSSEAAAVTPATRRRMQQQVLQSLRSVGSVRQLDITVNGVVVQMPEGGSTPDSSFLVGNDPVGALDGRIGVLTADGVKAMPDIGDTADAVEARGGSIVSHARDRLVLGGSAGVTLVSAGAAPQVVDARSDLAVPSLDPFGYIWSVPRSAPSQLQAIGPDGTAHQVPGMPGTGRVMSIDVARDGARLLVALETGEGPRLVVLGIQRDEGLVPTGLLTPLDLPIDSAALLDAAWVDGITVVALSDGPLTAVDAYDIGGQHTSLGTLDGGVAIVGGNTLDGTRVLDELGNIMRPGGGTSWQDTGIDATYLITQL
ncbi:MAG TPA: LpqB family beta-propeller domain-containing protein [Pseudolysinimonas sp.]|nr:LpqB family beta-propeller domain-containing protein [Pseudolysinimonas sp.]